MKTQRKSPTRRTSPRVANAGGKWTNRTVVVHGNLVTSRKPSDIPTFNRQILRAFGSQRTSAN
jgi:protease I